MDSAEFSNAMEQVYKEALRNADAIIVNAERIRAQAQQELEAANEKVMSLKKEGEKLTQQYFEEYQDQIREAIRLETLRNLTKRHIEAGKKLEDISCWLDVTLEFIQAINVTLSNVGHSANKTSLPAVGKLRYENNGSGGSIYFQNERTSFSMWWEFAGEDAVAIVAIPSVQQWQQQTHLPLSERDSVLNFIGEQVVKDQLSGNGSFLIGENVITYYKK